MAGISAALLLAALILLSLTEVAMQDPGSLHLFMVLLLLVVIVTLVVTAHPEPSPFDVVPVWQVPSSEKG